MGRLPHELGQALCLLGVGRSFADRLVKEGRDDDCLLAERVGEGTGKVPIAQIS